MKRSIITLQIVFCLLLTTSVKAQRVDPWIVQAYQELYKRYPTTEETNIYNYNNGSWNSYDQLKGYIRNYINNKIINTPTTYAPLPVTGTIKGGTYNGRSALALLDGNKVIALNLIGNDGSTLVGNDGASLIGNDGSTLVGNDGASLVSNSGSTLISNNNTYSLISNTPSLRIVGKYQLTAVKKSAKKAAWKKYTIYIR